MSLRDYIMKLVEAVKIGSNDTVKENVRETFFTLMNHPIEKGKPIFDRLLSAGAKFESAYENGRTPMHDACIYGKSDYVRLFAPYTDINKRGDGISCYTPIEYAIYNYQPETLKVLIELGASTAGTMDRVEGGWREDDNTFSYYAGGYEKALRKKQEAALAEKPYRDSIRAILNA